MTDGDALLRAILDNPADDTARLAYADYLQEHGQESRAEFIRVQIQMVSNGTPGSLRALFAREQACWPKGHPEWADDAAWTRGFITKLFVSISDFLEYSSAIFSAHPIEQIIFNAFRVEIIHSNSGYGWHLHYYRSDMEWTSFMSSTNLKTRDKMVAQLVQNVRDLEAEFA